MSSATELTAFESSSRGSCIIAAHYICIVSSGSGAVCCWSLPAPSRCAHAVQEVHEAQGTGAIRSVCTKTTAPRICCERTQCRWPLSGCPTERPFASSQGVIRSNPVVTTHYAASVKLRTHQPKLEQPKQAFMQLGSARHRCALLEQHACEHDHGGAQSRPTLLCLVQTDEADL